MLALFLYIIFFKFPHVLNEFFNEFLVLLFNVQCDYLNNETSFIAAPAPTAHCNTRLLTILQAAAQILGVTCFASQLNCISLFSHA